MPVFAYRILPPRANFAETITDDEAATMAAHFRFLHGLEAEGRVIFVGRCENGARGLGVFEFADEAEAREVLSRDPAVASGLMRMELRTESPFGLGRLVQRESVPQVVSAVSRFSQVSGWRRRRHFTV